jgi:hypothetical protein
MFRALINDAKTAAGAVIGKYAIRASVAVPFVVAAGFGTAALTVLLAERFGALAAYGLMAAGFAAVGLLASLVVTVKEQEEETADAQAEQADTADVTTDAATQAAVQLPIALIGTLLTTPLGPGAAAGGAKMLLRNLPLVLFLALIGLLFWPSQPAAGDGAAANAGGEQPAGDEEATRHEIRRTTPNGMDHHATL